MSFSLRIHVWGTRGSLPAPMTPAFLEEHIRDILEDWRESGGKTQFELDQFLKGLPRHRLGGFGGNTSCVEVCSPSHQMIIDAGSGIRPLGYEMMKGPCGRGAGKVHLFFTHFHWDHVMGLSFFTPLFIPGNEIHVYSVQSELEQVFQMVFRKPYFPIQLEQLPSRIHYHQLEPRKKFVLGDLTIIPYQLDHPDPCWGYRVERNGKSYAHCVDTECTRLSREQLGADLPLYQGIDLMLFDAQYTLMETIEKVNWGHASASLGLDLAMRESIKRVLFMHFDPAASPEKIAAAESQARRYSESQLQGKVDWGFAHEGMVIEL